MCVPMGRRSGPRRPAHGERGKERRRGFISLEKRIRLSTSDAAVRMRWSRVVIAGLAVDRRTLRPIGPRGVRVKMVSHQIRLASTV